MNKTATRLILMTSLIALAACAPKRKLADIPPAPVTNGEAVADPNSGRPLPGSHADFVASVAADRVWFDTDKFDIDAEDQATLRSQAQWLTRYPTKRVTIEGHADERGTRDYNIALGERRANAAKNTLATLGVDAVRISTISYGKERPDALGSDETSWARNRRAVTVTVE
jgi:peptidoglycan-associated lipoprotein